MSAAEPAPAPDLQDEVASRPVSASEQIFQSGRVIDVRTDQVPMEDGVAVRDVVVHPGAVGIIALNDRDELLLVQQYRHPVGRMLWEPPAGLLDVPGEPPWLAARRELHEEAHVAADEWRVLIDLFTSPGMTDEALRLYLARGVHESTDERHVGEHEEFQMPTRWVPLDDVVAAVLSGRVHNPIAVSGALAADAARRRGWSSLRPAEAAWPEMSQFRGSAAARSEKGSG